MTSDMRKHPDRDREHRRVLATASAHQRETTTTWKVARLHGEFVWHSHPETDELFLVVSGELDHPAARTVM